MPNAYSVGLFEQVLNKPKNIENDTIVETYPSDLVCSQLNRALEYLHDNKIFSEKFKMDYKIRGGWGYEYLLNEYLSYKLNVPEKEVWSTDKEVLLEAMKHLKENVPYEDTLMFINHCDIIHKTKKKSKWKILISKTDKESILIQFTYKKRPNLHGNGLIYLFFFNENNEVDKYYETSWIE